MTPFYDPGPVFHDTARSVLHQSLQQWEWLIVNDGSTDPDSLALLEHYRHADPRIRVLSHDTNRGPSAARNTGFQAARAPYVVQLDSDDLLEPTAIEKWLWFLESHADCAFVKGYSVCFGAKEDLWTRGFHDGDTLTRVNVIGPTSAIRKAVHQAVGGYDETIREGLEDWDFWLRCAHAGSWGSTVPEYLDWYRRRPSHHERWTDWDQHERQQAFLDHARRRYPPLWTGGFPTLSLSPPQPFEPLPDLPPWPNALNKSAPRLLLLLPWLAVGGADKFNLDLLAHLTQRGWEVTIATTLTGDHPWLPDFARYTPDLFILSHFLRLPDYPRFLRYLIRSRQSDVVLLSNSEFAYHLLPYVRAHCPEVPFVDFCHMEEEYWKSGGYPRKAVDYQEFLDLTLVSSHHLKSWMVRRGAEPDRVRVCHTNIDPGLWRPDPSRRGAVRRELGIDDARPVILYTGRMCAQKQPRVFAQTMLRLRQEGRPFCALVAGDGPDLPWLRTFLHRHGLTPQVRLLDALPNPRIRDLMVAADLFFLPSSWEGIALTLYEAMACALPVVGADVGGQAELVTPECGVLLPRSDEETEAESYAKVLAALLDDPQRRRAMGQAGRRRVESNFRLDQMGERIIALLREATARHGSEPRPIPTIRQGHVCAIQAVEYVRLSEAADRLWREQQALGESLDPGGHVSHSPRGDWRRLAYLEIRRLLLPYYNAALTRNMAWLVPLKNRLKRALLARTQGE